MRNTGAGYGGGMPYENSTGIASGVTRTRAPKSGRSPEGKAALMLVDLLDRKSFSLELFVYSLVTHAGIGMRSVLLSVAKDIIGAYSTMDDFGDRDATTVEARRIASRFNETF